MSKNRTEKSRYQSQYGGGWITAPQRLGEMACERIAEGSPLGPNFWRRKQWSGVFRREVTHANKLLASFAIEAIMRAWNSPRGRIIRSLGAPFLRPLIEEEQRKFAAEEKRIDRAPLPETINTLEKPRPSRRHGKSIREKLNNNGPIQGSLFEDVDI